jgi:endonuclease III
LLETVRAMRATTRDDGTRTARPHLEKMTEHADAYLKLDASSIHESISSSTTNRLDRVVRTAKMLPRKFDDLDSARKKARALQKGARAELTVANACNFLHMAYTMVMRRYLGRTL